MAKKENKFKNYGIATQAIHTGTDYDEETGAVRRHDRGNKGKGAKAVYILKTTSFI